ncbi:ROK family protein [Aureimonas altamirensis]|uniref:ROK family transcriptional regulator n=1 Tax=Aureimonas altamirensis TaxID=370622 RepID=UPI001E45100D|nr:ROK family transcriptional regulator [Aureimonas altamirensis]UHD46429.1 ROK family protein [Aureimonas altamirensis]
MQKLELGTISPTDTGAFNRQRVINSLLGEANLSRSAIARKLGLSESALSRIVRDLILDGLVCEVGEMHETGRVGRRHVTLDLVANASVIAVIWLTVFSQGVSIVDAQGRRLASMELPKLAERQHDEIPSLLADGVRQLASRIGRSVTKFAGVHVCVVGELDATRTTILKCSLPNIASQQLGVSLRERLGLAVELFSMGEVFNIARMHHQASRIPINPEAQVVQDISVETALVLNVTIGVGAHLALPNAGFESAVNERMFGHVKVSGGQRLCQCGQRGCLGVEAGGEGVLIDLGLRGLEADPIDPTGLRAVLELAEKHNEKAIAALKRAGRTLGENIYPICAVVRLDQIVLAGSVGRTPSYAAAVAEGLRDVLGPLQPSIPPVFVCDVDYQRAAELSGVIIYLFKAIRSD